MWRRLRRLRMGSQEGDFEGGEGYGGLKEVQGREGDEKRKGVRDERIKRLRASEGRRAAKGGGDSRTRTCDILHVMQAL